MWRVAIVCPYYSSCQVSNPSRKLLTSSGWCCCLGLILPDVSLLCNTGNLQNLVHIIGENPRYIEPFLAEGERACQGGGEYNRSLYEAKHNNVVEVGKEGEGFIT